MKDESERLRAIYAAMVDGELLNLAIDIDSLSEVAKPLLQAEMLQRGLNTAATVKRDSSDAQLDLIPLTQVRTVDDLSDLRDVLDAAQISSFLGPSKIPGWIGVSVRKQDQERATSALEQASQEVQDGLEPVGDYHITCPKCDSPDVVLWEREVATDPDFHWTCEACQHEWEEEEAQDQ